MSEILSTAGNVIYEVDLDADAAIEGPFDTWLRDHIADLLQFPGFLSAEVLADTAPPEGRVRRTVQYRLRDQAALDDYLERHAPRMRAQGVALFGDRFAATRRVLGHREEFVRGAVSTENCLNCGEVLTGQHCSHCGQRARVRVLSLWGLTRDVLGDVLDWDSRIWRTLRPLAFSPGKLTQEYLRGRRAAYTPPFRMYLLLSLGFFLLATVGNDPGSSVKLNLGEGGEANLQLFDGSAGADGQVTTAPPSPAQQASPDASKSVATSVVAGQPPSPAAPLDAGTRRIVDQLVARLPAKDRERARREIEAGLAEVPPADRAEIGRIVADPCAEDKLRVDIGPLGERYGPRVREACRKIVADTPSYGRALFQNVPKMMFIFLPLIAAVMFVLYAGSGRYYVEHLLFVVHFHAFFFLGGIVALLAEDAALGMAATRVGSGANVAADLLKIALALYAPAYLYVAMRRVYGQGRFVTFLKYSALGIAYLVCIAFTLVGLLFYTALTL